MPYFDQADIDHMASADEAALKLLLIDRDDQICELLVTGRGTLLFEDVSTDKVAKSI
jgi:hypothetical protein